MRGDYPQIRLCVALGWVILFLMCVRLHAGDLDSYRSTQYGKSLCTGDPVSCASGGFFFPVPLFDLGGPLPLRYGLIYRSTETATEVIIGDAFAQNIPTFVRFEDQLSLFPYGPEGDYLHFTRRSGVWTVHDNTSIRYVLKETGPDDYTGYVYMMDPVKQLVYIFEKRQSWTDGSLRWVMDRNGNRLTYTYQPESWSPYRIEDGLGRSIDLNPAYLPDTVTDQGGRQYAFTYDSGRPVTITDPMGHVTRFEYDTDRDRETAIVRRVLPLGNSPYTQTYQQILFGGATDTRVTSQTDAYGNTTTFAYDNKAGTVTETRPDGTQTVYKHYYNYGNPEWVTDQTGLTSNFTETSNEQVSGVTDRMGDTTTMTYHAQTGLLASRTNAEGDTLSHTYTAQDQAFTNPENGEQVTFTFYNRTQTEYADGTVEQFTYDAKGNMLTRIDQAGKQWTYTYNDKGQVLTETNPRGGVKTYRYNADGTLASSRDSDTGVTRYAYDIYKQLIRTTHPDGTTVQRNYDLNDRMTDYTDENGNTYAYTYDANGSLTKTTDPAGNETQHAYDLMDRVVQTTDRLGKSTTHAYDNMNRLGSTMDPNGIVTTYGYDDHGWRTSLTTGGQTWETAYDDEGIVSSRTTPLGHTTTYETDKLGAITAITDPLNQTTTYTRDAMSRITAMTDALNRTTNYAHDGRGLLSSVTMPTGEQATYQYNDLGRLDRITDLSGNNWTFGYTAMGRPQVETDPLGNTKQSAYDNRGRRAQTTYPDGSTLTYTYDNAGNVTRQQHSDGTDLQFTYNELNQITAANGIAFTRDAEGRITATDNPGTLFGATYDDGGRLKTATYNNSTFTVTYSYDETTGLLMRVSDDLTGTQIDLTYDRDFRLRRIMRPNGVNATFTYDNAARLRRIREGAIIDIQYTLDAAGQVTSTDMTAPLDPADHLVMASEEFTYDAAAQVSTAGYAYDLLGRLMASPGHTYDWDGASRLTAIDAAALAYNGLGDLITRTEGGTTMHYYYNHAIGLTPIVAERDDTAGAFVRYYVWTPGGRLLYMIDASDGNKVYHYHFDRIGSTLALTHGTGAVTDAYAYTPYGRLLQHTGTNVQPFTFVGQWGVRQEGTSGTLYHMRARYYDATTARFLARDPAWPQLKDPKQINPYQYALGNPLLHTDETGAIIIPIGWVVVGLVKAKIITVAAGYVYAAIGAQLLSTVATVTSWVTGKETMVEAFGITNLIECYYMNDALEAGRIQLEMAEESRRSREAYRKWLRQSEDWRDIESHRKQEELYRKQQQEDELWWRKMQLASVLEAKGARDPSEEQSINQYLSTLSATELDELERFAEAYPTK